MAATGAGLTICQNVVAFPCWLCYIYCLGATPTGQFENRKTCRQNFGHSVELQHFAAEGLPSSAVYGALEGIVIMRELAW